MKITFVTLGCKLNQAETELLAGRFTEAGHEYVDSVEDADVYILNTCTVTATADAKSRHLLRQAHRRNPGAVLVAAGCYAERDAGTLSRIEGVRLTAGNTEKLRLPEILAEAGYLTRPETPGRSPEAGIPVSPRTRAFIRIQDGCSNFCSYCIVPFVRGPERSLPAEQVVLDIKRRVSGGVKEVVLTGTEIGSYYDSGLDLEGLLEKVLAETDIRRLRISSLQPDEITPSLLNLWQDPRMCPHFHLSLQSGSDSVLRRMNRCYTSAGYRAAVDLIRSVVPGVAITTDIIVGFPGETDDEYRETVELCRETGFARLHVFPYSQRPGTAAADMPGQVPDTVRRLRNQYLGVIARESAESYHRGFTGITVDVLWEQQSRGAWSGHTGNYITVYTRSDEDLSNTITSVRLMKLYRDGMWANIE